MSSLSNIARAALLACVASFGVGTAAEASYSCGAGVCTGFIDTGIAATELNANLLFPLFDANLGVLTSVSVSVTSQMFIHDSVVQNNKVGTATFNASESSSFSLADTTNPLSALASALAAVSLTPTYSQHYTSLAGGGTTAAFGPNSPTASITLTTPLSAFQAYGGGNDTVNVSTLTGSSFLGGGGNVSGTFATNAELTMSITYDYTVPEPASLALLGAGIASLGWIRRRKAQ